MAGEMKGPKGPETVCQGFADMDAKSEEGDAGTQS